LLTQWLDTVISLFRRKECDMTDSTYTDDDFTTIEDEVSVDEWLAELDD